MKEKLILRYSDFVRCPEGNFELSDPAHGITGLLAQFISPALTLLFCISSFFMDFNIIPEVLIFLFFLYRSLKDMFIIFSQVHKVRINRDCVILFSVFSAKEIKFDDVRDLYLGFGKKWNELTLIPIVLETKSGETYILDRRIGNIPRAFAILKSRVLNRPHHLVADGG